MTTTQKIQAFIAHMKTRKPPDRTSDGYLEDSDQDAVCQGIVKAAMQDRELNEILPRYIAASSIERFRSKIMAQILFAGTTEDPVRYESLSRDDPDYREKFNRQLDQAEQDAKAGKAICLSDLMCSPYM